MHYKIIGYILASMAVIFPIMYLKSNNRNAEKYNPALIESINTGATETMKELINSGADSNARGTSGITALMIAAQKGDIPLMQWLIAHGADVNAETNWDQPHAGKPALSFALESQNLDVVQELITAGADVNKYNDLGSVENLDSIPESLRERNNPLLTYAIGRKLPMPFIQALLDAKNVDVNTKSLLQPITPLMIAAAIGYEDAVAALLHAGADKNLVYNGKKAIDYARDAGYENIVELLF